MTKTARQLTFSGSRALLGVARIAMCLLLALPLFESEAATTPTDKTPSQFVVWKKTLNTEVTGGVLTKSDGCDGCADAGAVSSQSISSNGSIQVTASETDANRFVGLANQKSPFLKDAKKMPATSYTGLDFAVYFTTGGYAEVRENGIYRTDVTYGTGDVFSIAAAGNVIQYLKNGEIFYTSEVPPDYPLEVGALLLSRKATVSPVSLVEGTPKN